MYQRVFIITFLSFASLSCFAEVKATDCYGKENTQDVYDCIANEYIKYDKLLNSELIKLRLRIEKEYKYLPKLRNKYTKLVNNSEVKWLAYRDENCKLLCFEIETSKTLYEKTFQSCITNANKLRVKELQNILSD